MGKWVYLIDAWTDREEDKKRGRFNPVLSVGEETLRPLLNQCSGEAGAAYDRLPALYLTGIVRNILYLGLPREQAQRFAPKEAKS